MKKFEKHRIRIFDAIESSSLLVICGAGLSMSPPSKLPSAKKVAQECYRNYGKNDKIDPNFKEDISKIAEHYYNMGRDSFETFLSDKVPWNLFSGEPNAGHATLADLLLCNALEAVLSTNFDFLIESCVWGKNMIDFPAALDGIDATNLSNKGMKPLIKIHGCMLMKGERTNTLWTHPQLLDDVISKRIKKTKKWLEANLPNKHLIVIGFWTDWSYLNEVIEESLEDVQLKSVIVVDPANAKELREKAGKLWKILNRKNSDGFHHVKLNGDEFLEKIRIEYSKNWMNIFYTLDPGLKDYSYMVENFESEQLYNFRKDIEGINYDQVSRWKKPEESAVHVLKAHVKLLEKGAKINGSIFEINGKKIRVINLSGESKNNLVNKFSQPELLADIVLCAGVPDEYARENLIDGDSEVKWWPASKTFAELERK